MENVIVIATANDIEALPPELIRRFSEVFFVDLPSPREREDIFYIHLSKRGRNPEKLKIDLKELVKKSDRYTGSEIEKAVKESIIRAFRDGKRKVKTADVAIALEDTKPIAEVMKEKIDSIRDWAKGKARLASSEAEPVKPKRRRGRTIDINKEMEVV